MTSTYRDPADDDPADNDLADNDPDDDDLALLRAATSAAGLYLDLLLHDVRGSSTDVGPAVDCLRRLHSAGEPGAVRTALLLLTAWHWRRSTSRLIGPVIASGALTGDEVDELAHVCLFHDAASFPVPGRLFNGLTIELSTMKITKAGGRRDRTVRAMRRPLEPPLRRWAAGHVLRRDPARLPAVRERIAELAPRHAAAVMAGVLDSIDHVSDEEAAEIVTRALSWPNRTVRVLAAARAAERAEAEPGAAPTELDTLF